MEAATGRLMEAAYHNDGWGVRVRFEEGAFAGLLSEIATATAGHPNGYDRDTVLAAGLAFLITELVESPLVERLLTNLASGFGAGGHPTGLLADLPLLLSMLDPLRELVRSVDLAPVLEPLNPVFGPGGTVQDVESLFIPWDTALGAADPKALLGVVYAFVLAGAHALFEPGSWPDVLFREAIFQTAGHSNHTTSEVMRLYSSGELGPLGAWMAARILRQVDPPTARLLSWGGLRAMSADAFHRDYRVLLREDTAGGQVLGNFLGVIGTLSQQQVEGGTALLPAAEAAFLGQLAHHLRQRGDRPVAEAAWPAFAEHWESVVAPRLERQLGEFRWAAHYVDVPEALYELGEAYQSGSAGVRDFEQAAACFRKAAGKNHGASVLRLGWLYERGMGVPRDYGLALKWYRRAAALSVPHAACRIADLYADGRGVERDPSEAARWYRIDAVDGCSGCPPE